VLFGFSPLLVVAFDEGSSDEYSFPDFGGKGAWRLQDFSGGGGGLAFVGLCVGGVSTDGMADDLVM